MTIGEILIWEATNVLLLIPVVIALVILKGWLFLFGHPREKVFSLQTVARIRGALGSPSRAHTRQRGRNDSPQCAGESRQSD
jgi:hypothetical protein